MNKNKLFFILHSKVIINTIEYIFIGDEDCDIEIFNNIDSCTLEVYKEPQIVISEYNDSMSFEEYWNRISNLRLNLTDSIPLILFSENPDLLLEKVALEKSPIRVVAQDEFFLDNLFGVISEELTKNTVYYQM